MYIGYFVGKKSFCTVELRKAKVLVHVSMPPGEIVSWDHDAMRDVTKVGHYGMGDTEYTLTSQEQVLQLEPILRASYLRNRK
jgi:predicted transport protein